MLPTIPALVVLRVSISAISAITTPMSRLSLPYTYI